MSKLYVWYETAAQADAESYGKHRTRKEDG